ncbi:hypothetical protein FQA39_LY03099 [Lamprigera yunnana]|nr:hypothetical protein FQA39_LY03099 [Lamprigera yunnana]
MKLLLVIALLQSVCLIYGEVVDYRILLGRKLEARATTCASTTYWCSTDCKSIMYCFNGVPQNIYNCGSTKFCEIQTTGAVCSSTQSIQCALSTAQKSFLCADSGMFPDPIDCKKYHLCAPATPVATTTVSGANQPLYNPSTSFVDTAVTCPTNTSYNIATRIYGEVVDYRILLGRQLEARATTCASTTYWCSPDCKSIMYCFNRVPQNIYNCGSTKFCEIQTTGAVCSSTQSFQCALVTAKKTFQCADSGTFPDPIDCKKYHLCAPATPVATTTVSGANQPLYNPSISFTDTEVNCRENTSYNIATRVCDRPLPNNKCTTTSTFKLCSKIGEKYTISTNIYVFCVQLEGFEVTYPYQYNCVTPQCPPPS